MRTVSAPCINCLRFHYGICHEAPKQCHECGGFNHIERYCANKRRVTAPHGEPWPGTRQWSRIWGLDNDPELKEKVLKAIKASPGGAIWVDDQCIYQGNESHFNTGNIQRVRGRPVSAVRRRSPSPVPRCSPSPYCGSSPSPIRRRSPSPYQRPHQSQRSPRCATGDNAVVFEANQENTHDPCPLTPVTPGNQHPKKNTVPYLSDPALEEDLIEFSPFKPTEDRAAHGDVTNRQVSGRQNLGAEHPLVDGFIRQPSGQSNLVAGHRSGQADMGGPSTNTLARALSPDSTLVEAMTPESILRVSNRANEEEIREAYKIGCSRSGLRNGLLKEMD